MRFLVLLLVGCGANPFPNHGGCNFEDECLDPQPLKLGDFQTECVNDEHCADVLFTIEEDEVVVTVLDVDGNVFEARYPR